jgi:hypothetical protein
MMIDAFWFWIAKSLAEMAFGIAVFVAIITVWGICMFVLELQARKRRRRS